jgi:hypothetical protein
MGATLFWLVTGKKPIEAPARLEDPDPLPSAELLGQGKYSPSSSRRSTGRSRCTRATARRT